MAYVYIKLVVGDKLRDGGFVLVGTEHLPTVGHLAKHVYEEVFKHRGVVSSEMNIYVAESVDDNEPTHDAERKALSSSRLQVGRKLTSLEGLYLLAVVESTHVQGKHLITAHAPPLHFMRVFPLIAPIFVRLELRRLPFPCLVVFKSSVDDARISSQNMPLLHASSGHLCCSE